MIIFGSHPCWDVSHSPSQDLLFQQDACFSFWETAKCYVTLVKLVPRSGDTAIYISCPRLGYNFSQVDSRLSKHLKNQNDHGREQLLHNSLKGSNLQSFRAYLSKLMCHNRINFPQGFPKEKQILHPLMLKDPFVHRPDFFDHPTRPQSVPEQ